MKKITLFLTFLFMVPYYGQTALVNYQFENTLNSDAGNQPVVLVDSGNFVPYSSNGNGNPGRALATVGVRGTNLMAGYVKLQISTAGFTNINLSFDGRANGGGTLWRVFANKDGAAPTFNYSGVTTDYAGALPLNNDNWSTYNSVLSTATNADFNNSSSITVYLVAYVTAPSNRLLRLDNLKITGTPYCAAGSSLRSRYISNVKFAGNLNPDTENSSGYSAGGYANYASLADKAKQIAGGVINMKVNVTGPANSPLSTIKAWVDWNKNGVFDDPAEKIYDTNDVGYRAGNVVFGYQVPAGTAAGYYTIRIRASSNSAFNPCGNTTDGETEDYTFEVISDCAAKISSVSAAQQCGRGSVVLTATGSSGTTSYLWYTSEFGGSAIAGASENTYTANDLEVGSYVYYVTALNGSCESANRTPIRVVVKPVPDITFTQTLQNFCGSVTSLNVSSNGGMEEVTLLEEKFENTSASPLQFENSSAGNTDAESVWKLLASPHVPAANHVLRPALSSGFNGGNFAGIITDTRRNSNLLNYLTLKNSLNSTGYTDMKLEFDLYFFSEEDAVTKNYLKLQYSTNGGTNWTDLKTYISDVGIPSRFEKQVISLDNSFQDKTQLKFRFALFSLGSNSEWIGDIAAIDNIRIYGNKALSTNFSWGGDSGVIYNSSCDGPVPAGGASSVCIKPSLWDLENKKEITITATATLSNGCSAQGTMTITNNSKVWNPAVSTEKDWAAASWKPDATPPTADKCVIIKKPVTIGTGIQALAKNITIEPGGKLSISGTLKVNDEVVNNGGTAALVVESDGNLVQVNDAAMNSGNITAKRNITLSGERAQYNYIHAPVENFNLKDMYKDAAGNAVTVPAVLYHVENNNKFYNSSGAYIKGRALAVKEPTTASYAPGMMSAAFEGKPANGPFTYTVVNTNTASGSGGFNLIGNPYPSNIDLVAFYQLNAGKLGQLSSTFYFWDNRANSQTVQMGNGYGGQAYAQFNAENGTGTVATGDEGLAGRKAPTKTVKTAQGFMVKTSAASQTLLFNNSIRTTDHDGVNFFGTGAPSRSAPVDRFWIRMITPANLASALAVVYFADGNNGFSKDDSRSMGGSDALYSVVEDEKVSINGKSSFVPGDAVPLGSKHFVSGTYRIVLDRAEGVFASGQAIYLKDKQTGTVTLLNDSEYVFAATAGESTGRFEIIYQPETILATDGAVKEELTVYKDGNSFVVKSPGKKITALELYDAAGRLVFSALPNTSTAEISTSQLADGVYILKVSQNGKVISKKVIK